MLVWAGLSGCATDPAWQRNGSDLREGDSDGWQHTTHTEYWSSPAWKKSVNRSAGGTGEYADLWDRVRAGLILSELDQARIDKEVKRYRRYPKTLRDASERAKPFLYLIMEETDRREMPADVALLPFVESAFHTQAFSHGSASGLWQIVPGTGRRFGLVQDWWYDGRRDVSAATVAALSYLDYLLEIFDGDWLLALAAYNAGEGTVSRAVKRNRERGKPTDFWSLDLPKETKVYVPRLLAVSRIVANPEKYGVELAEIPNQPALTSVDTGGQIDLAIAADLAGISVKTLYGYNPGFNRWATPPDGPNQLLLPIESSSPFLEGLEKLPADSRFQWTRYRVVAGDTLSGIAVRHNTTPAVVRNANNLNGVLIRAGDHLLIPVAARSLESYPNLAALAQAKSATKRQYQVRRGDSLWSIAQRYGVSHQDLAKWNQISTRSVLRPGTTLAIRGGKGTRVKVGGMAPAQTIRYRVRQGDSLTRISRRFNVSIAQLKDWNGLGNRTLIRAGQTLTIHVDPTRQS